MTVYKRIDYGFGDNQRAFDVCWGRQRRYIKDVYLIPELIMLMYYNPELYWQSKNNMRLYAYVEVVTAMNIKSKTDALLNIKHESIIIRMLCGMILKEEVEIYG